jgi:hypothetical protein
VRNVHLVGGQCLSQIATGSVIPDCSNECDLRAAARCGDRLIDAFAASVLGVLGPEQRLTWFGMPRRPRDQIKICAPDDADVEVRIRRNVGQPADRARTPIGAINL